MNGKAFQVGSEHDADLLCKCETAAYEVLGIEIELDGGSVVRGNVFMLVS